MNRFLVNEIHHQMNSRKQDSKHQVFDVDFHMAVQYILRLDNVIDHFHTNIACNHSIRTMLNSYVEHDVDRLNNLHIWDNIRFLVCTCIHNVYRSDIAPLNNRQDQLDMYMLYKDRLTMFHCHCRFFYHDDIVWNLVE